METSKGSIAIIFVGRGAELRYTKTNEVMFLENLCKYKILKLIFNFFFFSTAMMWFSWLS